MEFFRCLALTTALFLACLSTTPWPSMAGHHQQGNYGHLETLLVTGVIAKVLEKKGGGKHPKIIPVYVPVVHDQHHHHHQQQHNSHEPESHHAPESRMAPLLYPMPLPPNPRPIMFGMQRAGNQALYNRQASMNTLRRMHAHALNPELVPGVHVSDFQPKDKVMVFNINV